MLILVFIHKEVRAKLSVRSGLKWDIFLFHIMHWVDALSNEVHKYSTSLKNSLTCCAGKKEEHCYIGHVTFINSFNATKFPYTYRYCNGCCGWSMQLSFQHWAQSLWRHWTFESFHCNICKTNKVLVCF